MRLVAESFAWPFRGEWRWRWAIGILVVLLSPLLFIVLFGYGVAAIRSAEPPPWNLSRRLVTDGFWTALLLALSLLPFAIVWNPLAQALQRFGEPAAHLVVLAGLVFVWGLNVLLYFPFNISTFAMSGRPRDLFAVRLPWRRAREEFVTWNSVVSAIVTAWAIGIACAGALCIGIVPGIFYAILVSAHAAATLAGPRPHPSAG